MSPQACASKASVQDAPSLRRSHGVERGEQGRNQRNDGKEGSKHRWAGGGVRTSQIEACIPCSSKSSGKRNSHENKQQSNNKQKFHTQLLKDKRE